METFTYEKESHEPNTLRIIGAIFFSASLFIALLLFFYMQEVPFAPLALLGPGGIGLMLFLKRTEFDKKSFRAGNGFIPNDYIGDDGKSMMFAYDRELSLICISKRRFFSEKYDVKYYQKNEVKVDVDVDYIDVQLTEKVAATGGDKTAAFIIGGLPLAAAVSVMGKKQDTGKTKEIMKVVVNITPIDSPDDKHELCLFQCTDTEKINLGQGKWQLNAAYDFQSHIVKNQPSNGK